MRQTQQPFVIDTFIVHDMSFILKKNMRQKTTIETISQQWQPQEWATSVHLPIIHRPSSLYSPIWRHVSASFKTENFKWISYITHSPHATMNRSITLSAGAKPARQAHTLTSFSTAWKSPYYHQHIRNHSAFQMFDMNQVATNYVLTLNKLAFLLSGAVNHQHSWSECASCELILTRWNERHNPPNAALTVGENKRSSLTFIKSQFIAFLMLELRQFSLS